MDITALNVQYEDVHEGAAPPALTVTESSPMTAEPRTLGRDSPDNVPVVKTDVPVEVFGYLQKQGRRLKGWHQRWFELRGKHMYYFKNSSKKHCLGEIQLEICISAQPIDAATFGHPFEITTKERTHVMAARTQEDLEKWIEAIRKNMGPKSSSSPKKAPTKVKKWDSFKNAFHITRTRSPSPQPPSPSPTPPPSGTDVTRSKSFLDKFKRVKRDRSNSTERRTATLRNEEKVSRPLSEDVSYSQNQQQLVAALVDLPTASSVPNSPLSRKRQMSGPVRGSRSPSRTPGHSSGEVTPHRTTPERSRKQHHSPPKHTSTPLLQAKEPSPSSSPPNTVVTPPQPSTNITSSPSRQKPKKQHLTPPSPLASSEVTIPEIITKSLVWDELREQLESIEDTEPLFAESLPPMEEPWKEKEDPIEQLREFLAVCP